MVYPPKEESELDESFGQNRVIDFDKLSAHRRSLMRNEWDRETTKGDSV